GSAASARRGGATSVERRRRPSRREPLCDVEHDLDDIVAELLLDEDPEGLAAPALDDRGYAARDRACRGQELEIEIRQAPHQLFALDLERSKPCADVVDAQPGLRQARRVPARDEE